MLEVDEAEKLGTVAMRLWEEGKIVDPKSGEAVPLRIASDGSRYGPHYAVAKYALLKLVNSGTRVGRECTGRRKRRRNHD